MTSSTLSLASTGINSFKSATGKSHHAKSSKASITSGENLFLIVLAGTPATIV